MVGMPASVSGLGQSDALELWLRDVNGQGRNELIKQYKALEKESRNYPAFENLSPLVNENKAEVFIQLDQNKAKILGIDQQAIRSTLSTAWGETMWEILLKEAKLNESLCKVMLNFALNLKI